ncbi:MAG TPA: hypothetical protein IAB96_01270 [Candidatus Coprenecus pullicola]|nr:hypothetical protein [Candidatus Coprenecus pullicola]
MYKRLIIVTALAAGALQAYAQLTPQYYNNALLFSSQFYDGTARSVAMGNAMTALGGDLGALSYNPAASGVYRYTEITLTPSVYSSITNTSFLGNTMQADKSRLSLSNVGWVGSFETGRTRGLVNFNFAITANQSNNFAWRSSGSGIQNSSSYLGSIAAGMSATGIDANSLTMPENDPTLPFYRNPSSWVLGWNTGLIDTVTNGTFKGATENVNGSNFNIPGSLNQSYYRERTGYVEDIIFNFAGNVSDIFFFGVNLTLQSIWMNEYTSISETAANPNLFDSGFTDFTREYRMTTSGLGVNVEAGFIVRPVAGLTIGGSISTPTWMFLNETWMESMNGNTSLGRAAIDSPLGENSYRITSPFRWNVGVGYTVGGFLAIAVDYERTNYSNIVLADNSGNSSLYQADNEYISTYYRAVNNLRAGIEAWPIPQLALRLGYNYYSSPDRDFDLSRHYASAGIGFRALSGFFIDLAYQQQCNQSLSSFQLYDNYDNFTAPIADERFRDWKILLTLGWRF